MKKPLNSTQKDLLERAERQIQRALENLEKASNLNDSIKYDGNTSRVEYQLRSSASSIAQIKRNAQAN